MAPVIRTEGLSKRYIIRHQQQEHYQTMRDVVVSGVRRVFGRSRSAGVGSVSGQREEFWALKDVSFEVKEGERVGIIGRNGAGKSTLLKVLSRITEPTVGRVSISGRLASLLEVGTGFHPELTGRENIFLNGAVLGMSRIEIKNRFDEIVAFAEVEKFLDTPVKRYSSGMYVRLAFAVAAHLEPEILVVDEVLAVGDVQFQKKCLKKMDEAANTGKTILLVSHNMPTIMNLSDKVLLLAQGQVVDFGSPQEVVSAFQREFRDGSFGQTSLVNAEHYGEGHARFVSISTTSYDSNGMPQPFPETGCDMQFDVEIESMKDFRDVTVALTVYDDYDNRVVDACTLIKGDTVNLTAGEIMTMRFILKDLLLKPGIYSIGLWMGVFNQMDIDGVRYSTSFKIESRREDILYTAPFPGTYMCEFHHEIVGNRKLI